MTGIFDPVIFDPAIFDIGTVEPLQQAVGAAEFWQKQRVPIQFKSRLYLVKSSTKLNGKISNLVISFQPFSGEINKFVNKDLRLLGGISSKNTSGITLIGRLLRRFPLSKSTMSGGICKNSFSDITLVGNVENSNNLCKRMKGKVINGRLVLEILEL